MYCFFFFSSRRRHTRLQGDWSSDVCSSDLGQTEIFLKNGSISPTPWGACVKMSVVFRRFAMEMQKHHSPNQTKFAKNVHRISSLVISINFDLAVTLEPVSR